MADGLLATRGFCSFFFFNNVATNHVWKPGQPARCLTDEPGTGRAYPGSPNPYPCLRPTSTMSGPSTAEGCALAALA